MCVTSKETFKNCSFVSGHNKKLDPTGATSTTSLLGSTYGSSASKISMADAVIPEPAVQQNAEKPPPRQSLKSRIKSKLTPKASNFHYLLDFLASYHSMMHSLNGLPAPYVSNSEIVAPVLIPGENDDYMARVTMTRNIPPGYIVHYQRNYSPKRNKNSETVPLPECLSPEPQPGPAGMDLVKQ